VRPSVQDTRGYGGRFLRQSSRLALVCPEFAITRRRKLHHLSRYSDNAGLVYGGSPRSESLLKCHLPLTDPVGFLNSRAGTCVRNPPHVRERQIVHRTVDLLLRSQTRAV
jgi:hypothetical protein